MKLIMAMSLNGVIGIDGKLPLASRKTTTWGWSAMSRITLSHNKTTPIFGL